ncbi:MAG: PhzF family phenazine biosynthesis protein [Ramlibacter sp.]
MKVTVDVVHAFDHKGSGGNPAGVVLDADSLAGDERQAVAAATGLSETAFVSRSNAADFRLEFFTPKRQIAHCGHATIATFSYLRQIGRVRAGATSKETIDGRREILIEGDTAFMEQRGPVYVAPDDIAPAVTRSRIHASLGAPLGAAQAKRPPIVCSTGNRFLLVALRDDAALRSLEPDMRQIEAISDELDLIGYYAWAPAQGDCAATTRMFAPRYGIDEEAATGMAAGPLACYLHDRCGLRANPLVIEQGAFMTPPSPSRLTVNLESNDAGIRRLFVGGTARHVRTLAVDLSAMAA